MQKSNNHKSVTPIPPPLNQRFRRGGIGGKLKRSNLHRIGIINLEYQPYASL